MTTPQSGLALCDSPLFAELLESLSSEVRRMAERRTDCPGLRDDAYQEGLIAVARAVKCYDSTRGVPIRHYVRASARNAVSKFVQRNVLKEATGVELNNGTGPRRQSQDHQEAVEEWLARLPIRLRVVFAGLYVEGLSQRQLARRLQVSQPRVATLNRELIDRGRLELVSVTD